ncbi:hypothetical protein HIM_03536 [Hirsutella minnesotensis 3608]|uniref:Esterase-like protein n=1 Tax=Hirsutella minnesotensis 3608 TaxID=1043627 RepID=A0A0F7ZQG6_9HYPO|nr:hypothetical protein HIM_03536 [Hirsutella minnesotensis 3608]
MIRSNAPRVTTVKAVANLGRQWTRWKTYDKSTLTIEALTEKIESGLGEDTDGNPLRIDIKAKTVSTAAGDLPISPLLDPTWIKAKRRESKDKPKPTGRFRKKLVNNPYAKALATPLRRCSSTNVLLPRFFLQDFELVKHPTTGGLWWAPGPLSFEYLHDKKPKPSSPKPETDAENPAPSADQTTEATTTPDEKSTPPEATKGSDDKAARRRERLQRGPVVSYALSCKPLIESIGTRANPQVKLTSLRNGLGAPSEMRGAVWREDMAGLVLETLRRFAVDRLISPTETMRQALKVMLVPCKTWDEVGKVDGRGCVLWLPNEESASREYATLDIDEAVYGKKITVHNLPWLFGEAEVERLRSESSIFRDNAILVLKQGSNEDMARLHMLLWRLQGYLAPAKQLG